MSIMGSYENPIKKVNDVFSGVGRLVLILAAVWVLFMTSHELAKKFSEMNPNVAAAIVAGAATAFASVFSLIANRSLERNNQITKEHREHKVPIYEDLIQFVSRTQFGEFLGDAPSRQESLAFYSQFQQKLMVWGDDYVLKQFIEMHKRWADVAKRGENAVHSPETMAEYEKLVIAIRRDLGHRNSGLIAGDILSLWAVGATPEHEPIHA